MIGISAVVATLNRKEELKRLFDSLLPKKVENFELIIVDQNKDDRLKDLIEEYSQHLDIHHLRLAEANQSKARNYGARMARYSFVCFPDDDCWFEKGAMPAVLNHFYEKPETDLLVINWKQNPFPHPQSFQLTKKQLHSFRSVGYVTYVLFFKKEVFRQLGGFIENVGIGQYIGGGEDSELTFRAAHYGLNIFYNAAIGVNHKYIPVATRAHSVIRARQRGLGMVYAKFDIPYTVILRGMVGPLVKAAVCFDSKKSGEFYNMFRGRVEGFVHTLKQKKKEEPQAAMAS